MLRGDGDAIKRIARDPRATDQAVAVVFFSVLFGTVPAAFIDPYGWMLSALGAATIGLALFTLALWLVGKAFDGDGGVVPLFRASGFATAPLVLGLVPGIGLYVGAAWSFMLAIRVVRTLHVEEPQTAFVATVLPALVFLSTVAVIAASFPG